MVDQKKNGVIKMKNKFIYGLFLCFIIVCTTFTGCHKKKSEEEVVVETTVTPTVTPDITGTPTMQPEDTIEEPTPSVTETVEEVLSQEEALKIVQNKIDEQGYFVELLMDNLEIGDKTYYEYQISDGSSVIEQNLIVDKASGELLCYNADKSIAPFSEFSLYSEPTVAPQGTKEFTKEDAYDKLSRLSAKTLGLPEKLQKYTIEYDEWTTNVNGIECYGINVFADSKEKKSIMGVFYIALDGTKIFKFDTVLDDFIELE